MLISSNELKSLLKRVFEGLGYSAGAYEDAAELVNWLQMHGENGFNELQRALPYLADAQRPAMELLYEDRQTLVVDCHGRSGLQCLPAIVDLARSLAVEHGGVGVRVLNCHNRKFVLKLLADCARHGVSAQAYWRNGTQYVTESLANIAAGSRHPAYCEALLEQPGEDADRQSLSLQLNARVELHGQLRGGGRCVAPQEFARAYASALEHGMDIPMELWNDLNRLGEAVLVENSERSRSGAGGR